MNDLAPWVRGCLAGCFIRAVWWGEPQPLLVRSFVNLEPSENLSVRRRRCFRCNTVYPYPEGSQTHTSEHSVCVVAFGSTVHFCERVT